MTAAASASLPPGTVILEPGALFRQPPSAPNGRPADIYRAWVLTHLREAKRALRALDLEVTDIRVAATLTRKLLKPQAWADEAKRETWFLWLLSVECQLNGEA